MLCYSGWTPLNKKVGKVMLGQLSISFCDTCNEFGMVSVVDGKLMIQYCDCEVETVEGE
jgi:hypothetical protein